MSDCGCVVSHPRWCAWNGPCCDDCSHGHEEAHIECCGRPIPSDPICPERGIPQSNCPEHCLHNRRPTAERRP